MPVSKLCIDYTRVPGKARMHDLGNVWFRFLKVRVNTGFTEARVQELSDWQLVPASFCILILQPDLLCRYALSDCPSPLCSPR